MANTTVSGNKTRLTVINGAKESPQNPKWVEFWKQYEPYVHKICHSKLRRPEDVEDAVSIVKIQLFTAIRHYSPEKGSFRGWLRTIAVRRAIEMVRIVIKEGVRQGELSPQTTKIEGKRPSVREPKKSIKTSRNGEKRGDPNAKPSHTRLMKDLTGGAPSPRTVVAKNDERTIVVSMAVERTKQQVSAKQWQIFDCSWRRDWNIEEVCETLGVNKNQISRARNRVRLIYERELRKAASKLQSIK